MYFNNIYDWIIYDTNKWKIKSGAPEKAKQEFLRMTEKYEKATADNKILE